MSRENILFIGGFILIEVIQYKILKILKYKILKDLQKKTGHAKLLFSTYSYGVQYRVELKSSVQCSPYFRKYFETPCIKGMIVSKISDQFSDITIVLEFFRITYKLAFFPDIEIVV